MRRLFLALLCAVPGGVRAQGLVIEPLAPVPPAQSAGEPVSEPLAPAPAAPGLVIEPLAPAAAAAPGGLVIEPLAPPPTAGGLVIEPLAPPPTAGGLVVEPLAPAAVAAAGPGAPASPPDRSETRLRGGLSTRVAADTRWEPLEHVFELRDRAVLGLEHRTGGGLHLVVEGLLDHWLVARKPSRDHPLGRRRKADFELRPGELFADLHLSWVELRLGNQVFSFAANPGFFAAEPLNPLDVRHDLPLGDPESAKLPVPGVKAVVPLPSGLELTLVAVPLILPDRILAVGSDTAALQPGGPLPVPELGAFLSPTVEERVQEGVLLGERPRAYLLNGDAALSLLWRSPADVDVRLTHTEAWDKAPHFYADPQLQRLLGALAEGRNPATDPGLQAELASLAQRVQAGEGDALLRSELGRTRVTALAATTLVGPVQLDLDAAFEPTRTVYVLEQQDGGTSFRPKHRRALSLALGASDARGDDLLAQVTASLDATFGVHANEELFLLEEPGSGGERRTVLRPAVAGLVGWRFLAGDLTLLLGGWVGLLQLDFVASPRLQLVLVEGLTLLAGAELVDGPTGSIGGWFSRNDRLLLGLSLAF